MRRTLTFLALLAAVPAGAALAGDDCSVSRADWQPREAVARLAEENGWTVRRIGTDDGCYEVKGRDRDGREIEVEIHPATLRVIDLEYEDDDDDARGDARDPAPGGSVAPPPNGLVGNGARPRVQVN